MAAILFISGSRCEYLLEGGIPVGSIIPLHASLDPADFTLTGYYEEMNSGGTTTVYYANGDTGTIDLFDLSDGVFLVGSSGTAALDGANDFFQIALSNVEPHTHVDTYSHSHSVPATLSSSGGSPTETINFNAHYHQISPTAYSFVYTGNTPPVGTNVSFTAYDTSPASITVSLSHTHNVNSVSLQNSAEYSLTFTGNNSSISNTPSYFNVRFLLKVK